MDEKCDYSQLYLGSSEPIKRELIFHYAVRRKFIFL